MPAPLTEVPKLEDLKKMAINRKKFPRYIFENATTGICFFCAAFYGRNDVIDLYVNNIKDLVLVDVDKDRIDIMKTIYPKNWTFICESAFDYSVKLNNEGKKFDLVFCDPWTNHVKNVYFSDFMPFYNLANNYFVAYGTRNALFTETNTPVEKKAISNYLSEYHKTKINVVDIIFGPGTADGGTTYLVIKK